MTTNLKVAWQAPSNIAIVKYWGKVGVQMPINPSISFTLNNCFTKTTITAVDGDGHLEFYLDGTRNSKFESRLQLYFDSLKKEFLDLKNFNLIVESHNSFPHSAGIASSASSMAAFTLSLTDLMEQLKILNFNSRDEFFTFAGNLARLASGSACRSIYGGACEWGKTSLTNAVQIKGLHDVFKTFNDAIVIVDSGVKKVSSSIGHKLMDDHSFRSGRIEQANIHIEKLLNALSDGDIFSFGEILEAESLTLHAMMMTSRPSYILMRPSSLKIIEDVRNFRDESKIPVYFTLDAGPNVHLLYPDQFKERVEKFIADQFGDLTVIYDHVGDGPKKLL